MRILVTGGAGFIGSHVIDRLLTNGHQVVVLDSLVAQVHGPRAETPIHLEHQVGNAALRFVRGDVRDRDALAAVLRDADAVIHLAAMVGVGQSMYSPHIYADVNVGGQALLLELMAAAPRQYARLVVASSMSIYGEGAYHCAAHGMIAPPLREEAQLRERQWEIRCPACGDAAMPIPTPESKPQQASSIYAITKKTQEECALVFGRAFEVPTVALRFFNVYGSRQALSNPYTGIAAIFTGRLRNGKPPLLFEDGGQTRDFIHVHDVADAVVRAVELDHQDAIALNVCTGTGMSVRDVATRIAVALGRSIEPEIIDRYRTGDVRHCVGDASNAEAALGFRARIGFDEGLRELLAWSGEQQPEDGVEASVAELEERGLLR